MDDRNPTGWPQVLEELRTKNQELRTSVSYTYGHDLISQTRSNGIGWRTHFYGEDGHGNVRYLTDGSGEITDTYDYDAFGNLIRQAVFDPLVGMIVKVDPTNASLATDNHYLYTGEQFDLDLGMYFLRARYMDPNLGRFHTMDPFEGFSQDPISLHKYLYAHANPAMYVDPSGKVTLLELALAGGIGATVNTLATVTLNGLAGRSTGADEVFEAATVGAFAGVTGGLAAKYLFKRIVWLPARGMIGGLAAGSTGSILSELIRYIFRGEELTLNAMCRSGVRIFTASAGGMITGGFLSNVRIVGYTDRRVATFPSLIRTSVPDFSIVGGGSVGGANLLESLIRGAVGLEDYVCNGKF